MVRQGERQVNRLGFVRYVGHSSEMSESENLRSSVVVL